jgi:aerobic C4-dicarboxylate transport protein
MRMVDRFMSEARAITNTIGNAVGTVACWVGSLNRSRLNRVLNAKADEDLHELYEVDDEDASPVRPVAAARA